MRYDPEVHRRRSIRLRGYDYQQAGAYFVTICTQGRTCLFGEVLDGEVVLSPFGQVVAEEWNRTAAVRPEVDLDAFVVMPNHVHGIVVLIGDEVEPPVGATRWLARSPTALGGSPSTPPRLTSGSLGAIVGQFKSITTKRISTQRGTPGAPVWQRNFYEHVIRSDASLDRIRAYVEGNADTWAADQLHPNNPSSW